MNEGVPDMRIRKYQPSDCPRLAELFYQTVHEVNKQDYTKEQLNTWASGKVDLDAWNRSFLEHYTLIAVEEGEILGFGDIDKTGYLDHLYVHKDHQREGIASGLCDKLEAHVPGNIHWDMSGWNQRVSTIGDAIGVILFIKFYIAFLANI